MELIINQKCPSCGASITLHEDDTLIKCGFCDVHNYKIEIDAGRFLLPAKHTKTLLPEDLVHVPYIRFKGSIYYVQDQEVRHKIVDTTRIGIKNSRLPVSLGLRPQAISLNPVVSAVEGKFIRQAIPTKNVFVEATKTLDLFQTRDQFKKQKLFHRAFIGETLSRIYQPYFISGDRVIDGITHRVIGPKDILADFLDSACESKKSWEPRFISTKCPECGGLLSGDRDCHVLQCSNCESMWREKQHEFTPLNWQIVLSDRHDVKYLPFWCIEYTTTGTEELRTFGDYLRFTNQPIFSKHKDTTQPLLFLIPAFKVNPKAFLQLSSQLTLQQKKISSGKKRRVVNGYPVNLSEKEALQAIKSVLASTTIAREKRFPLLPEIDVKKSGSILTYLPFSQSTHDLVQEHTGATIQTAALRHGRSL